MPARLPSGVESEAEAKDPWQSAGQLTFW